MFIWHPVGLLMPKSKHILVETGVSYPTSIWALWLCYLKNRCYSSQAAPLTRTSSAQTVLKALLTFIFPCGDKALRDETFLGARHLHLKTPFLQRLFWEAHIFGCTTCQFIHNSTTAFVRALLALATLLNMSRCFL